MRCPVNEEFAEAYPALYEEKGFAAVSGVSVNRKTSWNPSVAPTIGVGSVVQELARITGDVRIGAGSEIGRRTAIRADEGTPIVIGANAEIEDRVTFHALKGTSITIGENLKTGNSIVFHGPLSVGDNLTIGEDAVLFRAVVGNNVTIGEGALVIGPAGDPPMKLRDGAMVPAGAIVSSQAQADAL